MAAQQINDKSKKIRSAMAQRGPNYPDPRDYVMSVQGGDPRVNSADVIVWNDTENKKNVMLWKFVYKSGAYGICSAMNPNMCMTAMKADGSYNGKVQMTTMCLACNGFSADQLWHVVTTASGKQRIKLADSKTDVYMHSCNADWLSNGQPIKIDSPNDGVLTSYDWKIEDS